MSAVPTSSGPPISNDTAALTLALEDLISEIRDSKALCDMFSKPGEVVNIRTHLCTLVASFNSQVTLMAELGGGVSLPQSSSSSLLSSSSSLSSASSSSSSGAKLPSAIGETKAQRKKATYQSWLLRYDDLKSRLDSIQPSSSSSSSSSSSLTSVQKLERDCTICRCPIESIFDSVCFCPEAVIPSSTLDASQTPNPHPILHPENFVAPSPLSSDTGQKKILEGKSISKIPSGFVCRNCPDVLIAKKDACYTSGTMGKNQPALFFKSWEGAAVTRSEERKEQLSTSKYILKDIMCKSCSLTLGWIYVWAENPKFKDRENTCAMYKDCLVDVGVESNWRIKESISAAVRHPRCHISCMISYIEITIESGFVGNCPKIFCPEITHADNPGANQIRIPFSKWSRVVSETALSKYKKLADGYMHFLCGQCHTSKSTLVAYESHGEDVLKKYLVEKPARTTISDYNVCCRNSHVLELTTRSSSWNCDARGEIGGCKGPSDTSGASRYRCDPCDFDYCGPCYNAKLAELPPKPLQPTPPLPIIRDVNAFMSDLSKFQLGKISAKTLYSELFNTHAPELKGKTDKDTWELVRHILQMVSDPERRAALQLHHWNVRPRFHTTCCNKEHCFKCKTKDFHAGKSCAENIASLDSSTMPCPSCKVFLTKSDGCDSVACVCGHKFAWKQALVLYKHVFKFASDYPENTAQACADVLCGVVEDASQENAMFWRGHEQNQSTVDNLISKSWLRRFSIAPYQVIAKCNSDSSYTAKLKVHTAVIEILNKSFKSDVEIAAKEIALSKKIALDIMYPNMFAKFVALSSLSYTPKSQLSPDEAVTYANLIEYKNSGFSSWSRMSEAALISSAEQFLYLFGSNSIATIYQRRDNITEEVADHFWKKEWCDDNLEISSDKLSVKRPGGISSYPGAFSKIEGLRDTFRVILEETASTTNSMSFGVSQMRTQLSTANSIPMLNTSGSDGVGRSNGTYGVIEDRGSSQPARVYADKTNVCGWRKMKVGDILTASIDLEALTCQISLNDEFTQVMTLAPGQYCFAMTFANDHKCRILNGEEDVISSIEAGSAIRTSTAIAASSSVPSNSDASNMKDANVRYLNASHWRLYSDFNKLLKTINSMETMTYDDDSIGSTESFITLVKATAGKGISRGNLLSPDVVSSTIDVATSKSKKNDIAVKRKAQVELDRAISWNILFESACVSLLESETRNREMEEINAYQFLEMWGDSAAFEAARVLIPNSPNVSKDEVRLAKAFIRIMPFLLEEWYEYNATLKESLIPELQKVPKDCRCIPRCIRTCNSGK